MHVSGHGGHERTARHNGCRNQMYTGLRHSFRLWLCRTLLHLTRRAYEPYPIAIIVRRTVEDELRDNLPQQMQNGR